MSTRPRQRPIAIGPLRAFEAVARRLSFRGAAEELHLTQSAISRQIQSLEDDVGAQLFLRGTRRVELTPEGSTLLRAVLPSIERLDGAVRQIRQARGRRVVSVTTFASFASLWLIPRLPAFQTAHPEIDIRIGTSDAVIEPGHGDVDVALRYGPPERMPPQAERLFGDQATPAASPWLLEHAARTGRPLASPVDLVHHTLLEEEGTKPGPAYVTWRIWLAAHGLPELQPARWLTFNYTHQQVQAALSGQGLTMMRLALTHDSLARGELIEVFPDRRMVSPYAYWLITPAPELRAEAPARPDVDRFCDWVRREAAQTDAALADERGLVKAPPAEAVDDATVGGLSPRRRRAR